MMLKAQNISFIWNASSTVANIVQAHLSVRETMSKSSFCIQKVFFLIFKGIICLFAF